MDESIVQKFIADYQRLLYKSILKPE